MGMRPNPMGGGPGPGQGGQFGGGFAHQRQQQDMLMRAEQMQKQQHQQRMGMAPSSTAAAAAALAAGGPPRGGASGAGVGGGGGGAGAGELTQSQQEILAVEAKEKALQKKAKQWSALAGEKATLFFVASEICVESVMEQLTMFDLLGVCPALSNFLEYSYGWRSGRGRGVIMGALSSCIVRLNLDTDSRDGLRL